MSPENRGGKYDPSLLRTPQQRIKPKSRFLRKLEQMQQAKTDAEILNVVELKQRKKK